MKDAENNESYTLQYPENEVREIIEILIHNGKCEKIFKGEHLRINHNDGSKTCYTLINGYVSLRNRLNGLVHTYAYPGTIIALGNIFWPQDFIYYRAEINLEVFSIKEDLLRNAIVENPMLWNSITAALSYSSQRLIARDIKVNVKNAYSLIRHILIDLHAQPEYVKREIPISHYILERVPLARSTIFRIVSDLIKGGYILADRGYMIDLKQLPHEY